MKKTLGNIYLLFLLVPLNLIAATENWSNFPEAKKTWLYHGVDPKDESKDENIGLPNYLEINNYILNEYLEQKTSGWKIEKALNFLDFGMTVPAIYKNIQISQRPYAEKRVPIAITYFIEKNNDPNSRLVVRIYDSTNLFIMARLDSKKQPENPLIKTFSEDFKLFAKTHNPFKSAVIEYRGAFKFLEGAEKLQVSWDALILDEKFKVDLKNGIESFVMNYDYEKWKKFGLPLSQGVLLSGPPGTGKSLVAKILATEVMDNKFKNKFSYIHVQANNINYVSDVQNIYSMARELGNTIVYFEDIDLIAGTNRFSRPAIKNELMQQLSGIERLIGVITIGTTNYGEDIDPALKRSQRLGLHFNFGPLGQLEREGILKLYLKDKADGSLNFTEMASTTDYFSGADLKLLSNLCLEEAIKRSSSEGKPPNSFSVTSQDCSKGLTTMRKMKLKKN